MLTSNASAFIPIRIEEEVFESFKFVSAGKVERRSQKADNIAECGSIGSISTSHKCLAFLSSSVDMLNIIMSLNLTLFVAFSN